MLNFTHYFPGPEKYTPKAKSKTPHTLLADNPILIAPKRPQWSIHVAEMICPNSTKNTAFPNPIFGAIVVIEST